MIYSPNKTLHGNFKYYEIFKSRTADRRGIDNVPKGYNLNVMLERAEQVAIHIAQPVRDEFGSYSPNSWFRCEMLEKSITAHDFDSLGNIGEPSSFYKWMLRHKYSKSQRYDAWEEYFSRKSHPKCESIDFEIAGVSNLTVYNWCKLNLPEYDQLIAEFMKPGDPSAGWVHGSHSVENNRMQLIQ